MTGREAAEEQEQDEARQRRRAAIEAQDEHDENSFWATQMVANSQRETSLVQLSALTQLSKTPSIQISSDEDISDDNDSSDINPEPRQSRRVKRPTRDAASQASQYRATALAERLHRTSPSHCQPRLNVES
jgi:hypothetical protein